MDPREGEHKPVKYAAHLDENQMLDLRTYMNITEQSLEQSVKDLTQEGIVLLGNSFTINFYDKEGVRVFLETMGAEEKVFTKI